MVLRAHLLSPQRCADKPWLVKHHDSSRFHAEITPDFAEGFEMTARFFFFIPSEAMDLTSQCRIRLASSGILARQ
jgi:hypothetical protein